MNPPGWYLSTSPKTRYAAGAVVALFLGPNIDRRGANSVMGITSWSQNYTVMGMIVFLLLLAILLIRTHGHPEELLGTDTANARHIREIHRA